jgi:pimeloyl-ACP methyl ester carboxylesterase
MSVSLNPEQILLCAELSRNVYEADKEWVSVRAGDGRSLILAVKGTNEVGDWKTNMSFLFKHDDTHDGFKRNAWAVAVDVLLSGLLRQVEPDCRIILSGHSLGGATATVLLDLLQNYYSNLALVTFGSPRPGGRMLRRRIQMYPHYRYTYGSDVVPMMPPAPTGYVHSHPPIILDGFQDGGWNPLHDHMMDGYLLALQAMFGQQSNGQGVA